MNLQLSGKLDIIESKLDKISNGRDPKELTKDLNHAENVYIE